MKKKFRFLTLGLCIFLLLTFFGAALSVSAATEGDSLSAAVEAVYEVDTETLTDARYAGELFDLLSDRILDHYLMKNAPDEVKGYVEQVISSYSLQKIYPIMVAPGSVQGRNPETQTKVRDWTLRALYAGSLAWMYYSNTDGTTEEVILSDGKTAKEHYLYLSETVIGQAEDGYFADRELTEIYPYFTQMLRAVFEAKLLLLSPAQTLPDSQQENLRALLNRAYADLCNATYLPAVSVETPAGTVTEDGEDGSNFRLIYSRTVAAAKLVELTELMYPGQRFDQLAPTRTFVADLGEADTPVEINTLLAEALDGLLSNLSGEDVTGNRYTHAYMEGLRAQSADLFEEANAAVTLLQTDLLTPIFSDYALKRDRAAAKDSLDGMRVKLLENTARYPQGSNEQNKLNNLIDVAILTVDGCGNSDEIHLEQGRGENRVALYDRYLEACEEIRGYLEDPVELLAKAEEQYNEANNRIAGSSAVSAMEDVYREADAALADTVAEAEAEAYRISHAEILSQITYGDDGMITDGLDRSDLAALEAAIRDTAPDRMSELAREKLEDILIGVGEAYRYVVSEIAEDILRNDALTDPTDPLYTLNEETTERVVSGILNTEIDPDDLPALLDSFAEGLKEAEAIRDVIAHVTDDIRKTEQYDRFAPEYTERIVEICEDAVEEILDPQRTEPADRIRDAAILDAERQEAIATVELSARDFREIAGVEDAVKDAEDRILNEAENGQDLEEIVGETAHRIDCLVTVSEIREKAEEVRDAIEELPYLNEKEREEWIAETEQIRDEQIAAAEQAQSGEELDRIAENMTDAMDKLLEDATAADLESGKDQATAEVTQRVDRIEEIIDGYEYMDDEERKELLEELSRAEQKALEELEGCPDAEALEQTRAEQRDAMDAFEKEADRRETADCLEQVKEDLNAFTGDKDHYSEERFEEIQDILAGAEERLKQADTIEEYLAIQAETEKAIAQVPDLLDEAQADAAARLEEAYRELMENKPGYSEAGCNEIDSIYQQTNTEISGYTDFSKIEEINTLTDERIAMMRNVLLNRIFTEDRLLASENPSNVSYDPWAKGYFGSLTSAIGLNTGSALHIYDVLLDGVAERIMQAAKSNRIVDRNGVLLSKDLNRLFRNCYVTTGLDITLGQASLKPGDSYELSVLLPDGTFLDHAIGVVFLREDGSAEYYELTREGLLVTFSTDHFSEYYIVSANTVNLVPLIVLMALILAGEIVVLAWLYLRRSRRRQGLAVLPAALFNPYRPEGAWSAIALMGVAIVLLAGWILILLLSEQLAKRRVTAPAEGPLLLEAPSPLPLPEPVKEVEAEPEEAPLTEPEAELESEPEIRMMEELIPVGYADPESYTGTRRGEINLDTLSDHFTSGETVTLNSMKALKLVPDNVGAVKVLGRGEMEYPMTVVAQGFSASAREAILEAGGEPIVTAPSAERSGPKEKR